MKAIAGIVVVGLLTACTSGYAGTKPSGADLDGTRWVFEANSLIDAWVEPIGKEPLTLEFNEGRVSGFAGCNTFSGAYTQSGDKLEIGPIGSTRMACEGDLGHQGTVVLEALEQVTSFKIDEVLIHMATGEGTAIVYRRSTAD